MYFRDRTLILLLFACQLAHGETETEAMDRRIAELMNRPVQTIRADTWIRPKEERELLIREYRKRVHPRSAESSVRLNLINLGDREATKAAVDDAIRYSPDIPMKLGSSGSPYAIEYLAPHFFSDEPYSEGGGDVVTRPLSFTAASTVAGILGSSSAFSNEVGNWARSFNQPDPVALRAEMQRWWKENKEHFDREDYKAVQPGRPVPHLFEVINQDRQRAGLPPIELPKPKPVIDTRVASPAATPIATGAADARQKRGTGLLYIFGAVLTLLIAAFAMMARQFRAGGTGR